MIDNKVLWDLLFKSLNEGVTLLNVTFYGYIWTPKRKRANWKVLHFRSIQHYRVWYDKYIARIMKGSALYCGDVLLGMYDVNGYLTREGEVPCL